MAIVKRVHAALENGPQKTKGLPLTARIAALGVQGKDKGKQQGAVADCLDDVVLVATGKAIQKALEVGMYYKRRERGELVVVFRTRTVEGVDDLVANDDDAEEEDGVRMRHVSCVEVGLRWKQ